MALTRILGLSNSPPFNHCRRTFSTALNHTRVVFPITSNRDLKTCSKRLIGPFIRQFSTSPMVSDDMQKSVTDDLIYCVNSLRMDVETLRRQVGVLHEVVSTIQRSNAQAQRIVGEKDDGNDYVGESIMNDDKIITRNGDSEGNNEKATGKKSDFSQAMATHFNTNVVISQDYKAAEKMSDLSEKRRRSTYTGDNNEKSAFSQAMATHFNTRIVISQNNKAAEKMSDVAEEIQNRDTEKLAAEKTSHFSEEIQRSDTEGNNEKAAEKMSDLCEAIATHGTDIQKCDTEEGNSETVPEGKEQDPLLKEIESEISRAVDFSCVTSQGVNFPDDFPFKLENDVPGVASITLKRQYKLENIVVTVSKPSIYTPITAGNYQYYKSSRFIMPLHVQIFSRIWLDIAFDCSVYSTGFLIEKVYGCDCGDTKGLVFSELNSNLQTEFKKYLEMRGIMPSITNIIFGYMLDKVNREKLRSLSKFKEMVEA